MKIQNQINELYCQYKLRQKLPIQIAIEIMIRSMGSSLGLLIAFMLFLQCVQSFQRMNSSLLEKIKLQRDYAHHFIFFNQKTFNTLFKTYSQIQDMHQRQDIQFYINDCTAHPLKQCQSQSPILFFNTISISIPFNGQSNHHHTHSHPTYISQIHQWILSRINSFPTQIYSKDQLYHKLSQTSELFCYCHANSQQKAYFYSLAKAFIISNYCILQNITLVSQLGLKPGNITMFKNGTLQHRVQYEYPNRYDVWEMFVKVNSLSHIKRSDQIIQKRFSQQNKNIDTTIIVCDFSFQCQQFWRQFQMWSSHFQQTHPEINIAMTFFDTKQALYFNLYLSTTFNSSQFPALMNLKILSENGKAGWLRRYVAYPQKTDEHQLIKFLSSIQQGLIPQVQLSAPIPPKNGFTGKHGQKLIQKVVAKNLNLTIKNSQKHYVLLLSALDIGCTQCEEFYKQYRKVASLLSEQDITFGFMDVLRNEVKIDSVRSIHQVLLYNKYAKEEPVVMVGRESFDGLISFLDNNSIINIEL